MLIVNGQLDLEKFKEFSLELSWTRVPRKLGTNHKDFFYIGFYENSEVLIKATIRPSLRMQVFESFKNRTLDGETPAENYKGKLCNWGSSVTVMVGDKFFETIKVASKESLPVSTQILEL